MTDIYENGNESVNENIEMTSDEYSVEEKVSEENVSAEPEAKVAAEKVEEKIPEPQKPENKKPKKERHGGYAALWVVTALCLAISIVSFSFTAYLGLQKEAAAATTPTTENKNYETEISQTTDKLTVAGVAEKVKPSTVMIVTQVQSSTATGTGMGSGFFITSDGYIVTNYHVIENAYKVTVTTDDGKEYDATVVGGDASSDTAVLKVEGEGFTPVTLGDSTKTKVGDQVVAIGTPYDTSLQNTVTSGYVSAVRDNYRFSNLGRVLSVFQHDAAINSGNSGGPLCNMYGEVIGINSAKIASSNYENISFAIQISSVLDIINELKETGIVDRPMIGITASTDSNIGGALIQKVTKGSPAEKAGIQVGDLITKVDGQRVTSTEEVISYFSQKKVGDSVVVTLLRDADSMDVTVTLFSTKEYKTLEPDADSANQNGSSQNGNNGWYNGNDNGQNGNNSQGGNNGWNGNDSQNDQNDNSGSYGGSIRDFFNRIFN